MILVEKKQQETQSENVRQAAMMNERGSGVGEAATDLDIIGLAPEDETVSLVKGQSRRILT